MCYGLSGLLTIQLDPYTFLAQNCIPNLTLFMRYENNKFLTNHLSDLKFGNLLFLYLTNEVEFGQNIL